MMINALGVLRSHGSAFNYLNKCIDVGIILGSFLFASAYGRFPWNRDFTFLAVAGIFLYYLFGAGSGLYQSWRVSSVSKEILVIVKSWAAIFIVLQALLFLLDLRGPYFLRVFWIWITVSVVSLIIWRFAVRSVLRFARKNKFNKRNMVIVGAGDLGKQLARRMKQASWTGVEIAGFFDDEQACGSEIEGVRVLGTIGRLREYLSSNAVDYVYVALPFRAEDTIKKILNECRTLGAMVYVVPDLAAFSLYNLRVERFGEMILLNFNPPVEMKRVFDLAFAVCAIVAALPVMLFIALAIKLEDGGPIFYRHRRVTRAGKEFKCLKFRTMSVDADRKLAELLADDTYLRAEWERTFKLKDDPRVTRIGRFLRKTSLDELPQFFNVLKGQMSVVGARPIVEKELHDYYRENGGLYCSIKPGITGPWQTGNRNDTEDYGERVKLDAWYVHNHCFLLDLKIIAATVRAVFARKGAY